MRSDAPSALPAPEVAAAALGLQSVDVRGMCDGDAAMPEASVADDEPARLGDRVPNRSPIPGFRLDRIVRADAARDRDVPDAAIDGYLAWFARAADDADGDDGYGLDVFRHLSPTAAASSFSQDVTRRACGTGVTAFEASGRDGLLILQDADIATTTAVWTSGTDLVRVTYGGWTDPAEALSRVAAVAGAAALY